MSTLPRKMRRPKIYKIGEMFYDMDFIFGPTLLETCIQDRSAGIHALKKVVTTVRDNISQTSFMLTSVFNSKINNVLERTKDRELAQSIELNWIAMSSTNRLIHLPLGHTHGDLTPENIVASSSGLYYLDGLRSPVSTVLQDVAKLRQEYVYGWSSARYGFDYDRTPYEALLNQYFKRTKEQDVLDFVTVARIAPYAKTPEVTAWIKHTLEQLSYCLPLERVSGLDEGQRHC